MDATDLTTLMANGVGLSQHDEPTVEALRALAASLAALWQVDVEGVGPAVGFDPAAGWYDSIDAGSCGPGAGS
jgi:hypothetical protein